MLAFSTAADVVPPSRIGTSAAMVNGLMFILGGVLIARPAVLGSRAIERSIEGGTLELAQHAGRPLLVALPGPVSYSSHRLEQASRAVESALEVREVLPAIAWERIRAHAARSEVDWR